MITKKTRLSQVVKEPAFAEYSQYLLPWKKGFMLHLKIASFQKIWNADSIVDGLNYMKELQEKGTHLFYPLYDPAAAARDPSLKDRVMFHFPVKEKTKCVMVCAGGGYGSVCSFVEAFPVAQHLNELGYHAFVVNYRVGKDALYPNPMDDLAAAVAYVQTHAKELNVDATDYAVMGFSAGGHLAASFGTTQIGYGKYHLPKPGTMMLAYPVITMGERTHGGTCQNLLGKENLNNQKMRDELSIEKLVTEDYPPCYLWQCDEDPDVPVDNSRMMAKALEEHHVPVQYELFKGKAHGWGLGKGTTAEGWLEQAVSFWQGERQ